jgi:hypothetical protein
LSHPRAGISAAAVNAMPTFYQAAGYSTGGSALSTDVQMRQVCRLEQLLKGCEFPFFTIFGRKVFCDMNLGSFQTAGSNLDKKNIGPFLQLVYR